MWKGRMWISAHQLFLMKSSIALARFLYRNVFKVSCCFGLSYVHAKRGMCREQHIWVDTHQQF